MSKSAILSVQIGGLDGQWLEIAARYSHKADRNRCPACGGLGIPWLGWFSCGDCRCVALVEDGRAFLPLAAVAS